MTTMYQVAKKVGCFFSGKEKKILECDYVHMCTKLVNFKKKVVSNGRTKQESANSF